MTRRTTVGDRVPSPLRRLRRAVWPRWQQLRPFTPSRFNTTHIHTIILLKCSTLPTPIHFCVHIANKMWASHQNIVTLLLLHPQRWHGGSTKLCGVYFKTVTSVFEYYNGGSTYLSLATHFENCSFPLPQCQWSWPVQSVQKGQHPPKTIQLPPCVLDNVLVSRARGWKAC